MTDKLNIVGGGMAGSEAARQAAEAGIDVVIHEMRPKVGNFGGQDRQPGRNGLLELVPIR